MAGNVPVTDRGADVCLNGSQQLCCPAERVTSVSSVSSVHTAESLTVSDRMDYRETHRAFLGRSGVGV